MNPLRLLVFLLALTLPCSFSWAGTNVLLIIADDFGIDASALDTPTTGTQTAPIPNLAALAANGVRFTHAYACPVCSPTRSVILTGRHAFRTGTGTVVTPAAGNQLKASEFTLPEAFAANAGLGYQLAQFGKWHLGGGNMAPSTIGGWPSFAGSLTGEIASYTSWTKVITNGTPGGTSSTVSTTYATTDIVNDARSWILAQKTAGKPWFAWVAFNAPHAPYHLPSPATLCPHYGQLSGTAADISAHPLNYYNAAVEAMDTEIGRLLTAVDFSNTTVIFLGDNGTPRDVLQAPFPANRGKDTLYEGGIRVPMIVRGPTVVAPGRTSDVFVHAVDLYATILGLAGISLSSLPAGLTLDSQDFAGVLANQPLTRSLAYAEAFDTTTPTYGGRALRDDRYKLLRKNSGTDEFYDLQTDPFESTNLAASGIASLSGDPLARYYRLRLQLANFSTTTAPAITSLAMGADTFSVTMPKTTGATESLWKATDLTQGYWQPVSTVPVIGGGSVTLSDDNAGDAYGLYRVLVETP